MDLNPVSSIIDAASGLSDSIFDGIDKVVTSDEERKKLKTEVQKRMIDFRAKALKLEEKRVAAQTEIIQSAKETPFWRNWRGLVMLTVGALAVLHAAVPQVAFFSSEQLISLLKWGLGAYGLAEGANQVGRHRAREKAAQAQASVEKARAEQEKHRRARDEVRAKLTPSAQDDLLDAEIKPAPPADIG